MKYCGLFVPLFYFICLLPAMAKEGAVVDKANGMEKRPVTINKTSKSVLQKSEEQSVFLEEEEAVQITGLSCQLVQMMRKKRKVCPALKQLAPLTTASLHLGEDLLLSRAELEKFREKNERNRQELEALREISEVRRSEKGQQFALYIAEMQRYKQGIEGYRAMQDKYFQLLSRLIAKEKDALK